MDLQKNLPIFGVVTAFVAGTLSIAYHNVALSTTVKYVFFFKSPTSIIYFANLIITQADEAARGLSDHKELHWQEGAA